MLANLFHSLENHIQRHFGFKTDSSNMYLSSEEYIQYLTTNSKGNRKVPLKHIEALRAYALSRSEQLRDQYTIFCYELDGKLYTTYNKNKKYYSFKGETNIPNYREDKEIEDKILKSKNLIRGFYYPCGKPYYTNKNSIK